MPYTKEQLRTYWQANKAILNQKRREKRRLARLAIEKVSHPEISQVEQKQVSHEINKVSPNPVSHGKPNSEMANLVLAQLIKKWLTRTNYNCAPGCFTDRYCNNC
jgi:hypothetical protein